jgi:hypothetical protein
LFWLLLSRDLLERQLNFALEPSYQAPVLT